MTPTSKIPEKQKKHQTGLNLIAHELHDRFCSKNHDLFGESSGFAECKFYQGDWSSPNEDKATWLVHASDVEKLCKAPKQVVAGF